jgi:hypothetical protein
MDDYQRGQLKKLLNEEDAKPFPGTSFTLFFPDKYGKAALTSKGEVPRKGEKVYIRNYTLKCDDPEYEFKDPFDVWVVEAVDWSMRISGKDTERLIEDRIVRAEVQLRLYRDPWYKRVRSWCRARWYRLKSWRKPRKFARPGFPDIDLDFPKA